MLENFEKEHNERIHNQKIAYLRESKITVEICKDYKKYECVIIDIIFRCVKECIDQNILLNSKNKDITLVKITNYKEYKTYFNKYKNEININIINNENIIESVFMERLEELLRHEIAHAVFYHNINEKGPLQVKCIYISDDKDTINQTLTLIDEYLAYNKSLDFLVENNKKDSLFSMGILGDLKRRLEAIRFSQTKYEFIYNLSTILAQYNTLHVHYGISYNELKIEDKLQKILIMLNNYRVENYDNFIDLSMEVKTLQLPVAR